MNQVTKISLGDIFSIIVFNFSFQNWKDNPGSGSVPGSGCKLGWNPGSGYKFNVFGSTTVLLTRSETLIN